MVDAPARPLAAILRERDAEIGEVDLAAPRHQHVGGAHVAVDDAERHALGIAGAMGVVQRVGDFGAQIQHELHRELTLAMLGALAELHGVEPVDELQDLERQAIEHAVVEHRHDVGVVQVTRDARLVEKHAHDRRLRCLLGQQPLDRDAPREAVRTFGARLEHLGRSTSTEAPQDVVAADLHGPAA